jgi:phospholipid/cholesterol/gamma-HCH transport system substrate-binding protein
MRLGLCLGTGEIRREGSTIEGITKRSVGEVIADMGEFLARSDSLLAMAVHVLNYTFTDLGKATESMLQDFRELALILKSILTNLQSGVIGTKTSLDSTISLLRRVTEEADSLIDVIQSGKGTFGKLIVEDSLYREMDTTIKSLRSLINDIKTNPERYLKVEVKVF